MIPQTESLPLQPLQSTSWIHRWKRKGWKTKTGSDVKNRDLWERLDVVNQRHDVRWNWVKGHADHPINNRADELANAATCPAGRGAPTKVGDKEWNEKSDRALRSRKRVERTSRLV